MFAIRTLLFLIVFVSADFIVGESYGGLYPRESKSRELKNLDGLWNFLLAPLHDPDRGFKEKWYQESLKLREGTISMAVPSSYNDVTQSKELRDHVGWAWYDKEFYVPRSWVEEKLRIIIRFGSAYYNSIVYINGIKAISHDEGHLPFSADVTDLVIAESVNVVTVSVNNTLTPATIPQGKVVYKSDLQRYPAGYFTLEYSFDFFNYAGIHRPVFLYTTPKTYIDDVTVSTTIVGSTGLVNYQLSIETQKDSEFICFVEITDERDTVVGKSSSCKGQIGIKSAKFWWPYLMDDDPGYMYTLNARVTDSKGRVDEYPQKFGIRTISWNSTTLTINEVPLYLRGCGKHEDANIIGKGVNYANIVKDFSLLKWLGANSFRTSHYPYAEEIMDMADEEGIMVIDESPAVNLEGFGDQLLLKHKEIMKAMHRRDKNRPSVIMWSVANEAKTEEPKAGPYFEKLTNFVRSLDKTRPVTAAINKPLRADQAAKYMDVLLLNRYFGWYSDTGHLELIERQMISEISNWFDHHHKPVAISEYGAGTITGLHTDPPFSWSEEYQAALILNTGMAFDKLRKAGFFYGEMIWNFADFATAQSAHRVGGNKKGIFTREREPKAAARVLRERYFRLAKKETIDNHVWSQIYGHLD